MLVNALRGHLAEFRSDRGSGPAQSDKTDLRLSWTRTDGRVPDIARQVLKVIVNQIEDTSDADRWARRRRLSHGTRANPVSQTSGYHSGDRARSSPQRSQATVLQIRTYSVAAEEFGRMARASTETNLYRWKGRVLGKE